MTDWDDLPWSASEMEDYRKGGPGKRYKRTWSGPSRHTLWQFYGAYRDKLTECPDCGRPHLENAAFVGYPKCWNCHQEDQRPGFHANANRELFPQKAADAAGAKGLTGLKKLKGDFS